MRTGRRENQVRYKKNLFSVVGHRNGLCRDIVGFPSLEVVKTHLNVALSNLLLLPLLWLWNLDKETSGGPSQPQLFCSSSYGARIKTLTLHSTFC